MCVRRCDARLNWWLSQGLLVLCSRCEGHGHCEDVLLIICTISYNESWGSEGGHVGHRVAGAGKETLWMVVGHDNAGTQETFNVPLERHSIIELYPSKKYCKFWICLGKDGKSLLSRHVHFVSLSLQTQPPRWNLQVARKRFWEHCCDGSHGNPPSVTTPSSKRGGINAQTFCSEHARWGV